MAPERTRSLDNGDVDVSYVNFWVESTLDLGGAGGLKEQLDSFSKILPRLLDGIALAGDVKLGAEGHIAIALALDQSRQCPLLLHNTHSDVECTRFGFGLGCVGLY